MAQKNKDAVACVFDKSQFLTSKKYASRRDLISVILEDGKTYSIEQVDGLIEKELKRKVI